MRYPVGYTVRLGIITNVGPNYVDVDFFDRVGEKTVRAPLPMPYAGKGGGVLVGPEKDTVVIMGYGPQEKWYVVGFIPDLNYYFDQSGANSGTKYYETPYPTLKEGEVCIKANSGARIDLLQDGNIALDASTGSGQADIELSNFSDALFVRSNNVYRFSEAGRSIEGIIKRDLTENENTEETSVLNLLDGEVYDRYLTPIGRSPEDEVHNRTTTVTKKTVRNPAFVEKRNIVYEYANSYNYQGFEAEVAALLATNPNNIGEPISRLLKNPLARSDRRTDVLNINLLNYNNLIESVQGTLVDIYGNVLDINRNIIPVPSVEDLETNGNDTKGIRLLYDYLRRSVKHHFEINARKPINSTEPNQDDFSDGNYVKNHSKFSLDIDGEGLTKINIPASSETGNIPVLGRYVNSRNADDPENGAFRDEDRRDIRMEPIGIQSGPDISNSDYAPKDSVDSSITTVSTAYHNILEVASSIMQNGRLRDPVAGLGGPTVAPVSDSVTNKIGESPNAGGRSLHANLDGSAEISIGADTVDRKSLVLDLAGGMISQIGRDKNGRSLIQQFDGDVIIQVGSDNSVKDKRFGDTGNTGRPGRVEIHLKGAGDEPQKIIIDEKGMTLKIQGNSVISSTGDTTISAGGRLLLHGELIFLHGSHDEDDVSGTRAVAGSERLVLRNGNVVI